MLVLESKDGKINKLQISGDGEVIYEYGMKDGNNKQQSITNNELKEMTLEEAYGFKTKSDKPFGSLSIEQLEYIICHGGAKSSMAAQLIKNDKENNVDLQSIPEEDGLPF